MDNNLPKEIERKYLIFRPSSEILKTLPQCERTDIVQTYLLFDENKCSRRIRKRGTPKLGYKYYYTEKTPVSFGERIEIEHEIQEKEYNSLMSEADPERITIKISFLNWTYTASAMNLPRLK